MHDKAAISVIITGATGMVGEGVLLECLHNPRVARVLIVGRKSYGVTHPKLAEILVADFLALGDLARFAGYDACFFCAGVSSIGMSEADYAKVTYELTLHFAGDMARANSAMTFVYLSGASTDGSEQGKSMWARVKGRTENALGRVGFKRTFNFRPGFMRPTVGQKNILTGYRLLGGLYPLLRGIWPHKVTTLQEVALAMILVAQNGYPKTVLEVTDINALAANSGD